MTDTQIAATAKVALVAMVLSTLCSALFLLDVGGPSAALVWGGSLWAGAVAFGTSGVVFFAYLFRGLRALRSAARVRQPELQAIPAAV